MIKKGVFLCTCSGTINFDFKKLTKSIKSDYIEIHEMLCQEPGKIKDVFAEKELSRALVACTAKTDVFKALDLDISYINLRERCAWVHDRDEATEKAAALVCAGLNCPAIASNRTIDIGRDVLIIAPASAGMRISRHLSGSASVRLLISDNCERVAENLNGIDVLAGKVKQIEGRIGDFKINIIRNPVSSKKCISCGKCMDVCPAQAIDLDEKIATLKAGQVLAIGKNMLYPERKKGFYIIDEGEDIDVSVSLALPALIEIIANTSGLTKDVPVKAFLEECAAGKSGIQGCTLCERACRHRAITRRGDKIDFDEISCEGCGACASVCPLSLFRMEDDIHSRMGYLLQPSGFRSIKPYPKIIMFTCEHSVPLLDAAGAQKIKYPAVLPLFVPDLACISENHILKAFDLGADGVIMLGCGACTDSSKEAAGFAKRILDELDLNARTGVFRNDIEVNSFARNLISFSENLSLSPIRMHKQVLLKNTSNRHILIDLISSLASKTGIVPRKVIEDTSLAFADISTGASCTVCGACTSMCPSGALRREEGSIIFAYCYCIACGLCEKACPEKALTMQRVFNISKLLDAKPSALFKSELQVCASCRKPYMTRAAFDKISDSFIENVRDDLGTSEQVELIKNQTELLQYCENCRPAKAILKIGALL